MTARKSRSPMFRLKVFEDAGGACHICGLKIRHGEGGWDVEHVIPLAMGGEDAAANMKPAHKDCHSAKTRNDVASIAKAKRVKAKSLGIRKAGWPKSKWKRKLNGETVLR